METNMNSEENFQRGIVCILKDKDKCMKLLTILKEQHSIRVFREL